MLLFCAIQTSVHDLIEGIIKISHIFGKCVLSISYGKAIQFELFVKPDIFIFYSFGLWKDVTFEYRYESCFQCSSDLLLYANLSAVM